MRRLIVGSLLLCGWATSAHAQFSDNKIVIGVMGDQSGVVADVGGPGSILAARMAVEDSGGTAGGVPLEIITADHQNKPDVATIATTLMFPGCAPSRCPARSPISTARSTLRSG